eukprot:Skav228710  [mRNA]  locus=scaffold3960:153821:158698:- [translate_table: standard]
MTTVLQQCQPELPVVVIGDTNARIGSHISEAISSHAPEKESETGSMLHAFLQEHELFLPATHEEFHEGQTCTWMSPSGSMHRIDFVMLPQTWKAFQIQSYVELDVDLATVRPDHFVAVVSTQMARKGSYRQTARCHVDVRKCKDSHAKEGFLHWISQMPSPPWHVGVGTHAEFVTSYIQQGAQHYFGRDRQLPKQRYMSNATWDVVLLRKALLKFAKKLFQQHDHTRLEACFQCWVFHVVQFSTKKNRKLLCAPEHHCPTMRVFALHFMARHTRSAAFWSLHMRTCLHTLSRHSSRMDRIQVATDLALQFQHAAHGRDTKQLFRALRPLLGQSYRKGANRFQPLPAVRHQDGSLSTSHEASAERWQQHFAEAEQGHPVSMQDLQQIAQQSYLHCGKQSVQFDIHALPVLDRIEDYIKQARNGKAPGPDGLPAEIYQLDPVQFAKILWPLMAKCSLRCEEPLRWRGGEIVALPKKTHPSFNAADYRSILLSDFPAKISHGLLRQRLLQPFESIRSNMQAGGIPKLGPDCLHLFVQSFAHRSKSLGTSQAFIFVDIKQAFYRAFRPLLTEQFISEETLARFFHTQGWSTNSFQSFLARMRAPSALQRAAVSPHQRLQVDSLFHATWFQLRNSPDSLTHTSAGTRPGDSVADLLFSYIMAMFLEKLRASFKAADLGLQLDLQWVPQCPINPGDLDPQHVIEACWVDDLVLLLEASAPMQLVENIQQAMSITHDLATEFALRLNYEPNKTAALISLRGPQAQTVWKQLLHTDHVQPYLTFWSDAHQAHLRLDVVADYIYLGILQDNKGHPGAEIHRKFITVKPVMKMLRRNVFRSPKMPLRTKSLLFRSLVLSKLQYGIGAFQQLHVHSARSWNSQLMNLVRTMTPHIQPGPGIYHLDILAATELCPPLMLLSHQRLLLFDRICQTEMCELFAVLQHQDPTTGWLGQVCHDIVCLQAYASDPSILQWAGALDFCSLAHQCHAHPKTLTHLGKRGLKACRLYLKLWQQFREFQQHMREDAHRYGISPQIAVPEVQPSFFQCDDCSATFSTYKALCTHVFKQHGDGNIAHQYAAGNCCRSCLKVYHSRTQLVHHLQYFRTGCLLHLIMTVPPLSLEALQEIRDEEHVVRHAKRHTVRTKEHKWPVEQAHGPKRPYPWHRANQQAAADTRPLPEHDTDEVHQWIFHVLATLYQDQLFETYHQLTQFPYHGSLASQVTETFARMFQHDLDLDSAAMSLRLQEAITLWKDDQLVVTPNFCQPIGFSLASASVRRIRLKPVSNNSAPQPISTHRNQVLQDLWNEGSVVHQLRQQMDKERAESAVFPNIPRQRLTSHPLFLYVFSGRRRLQDYQHWVEFYLGLYRLNGRVLLLDLALSEEHDVGDIELMNTLLRWVREGAVAALLLAPPCETWSEARFLTTGNPQDPRPLRSNQDPFALQSLTCPELEQLMISNFLLFVSIRLLWAACVFQVPSTLEHPREPKKLDRPSIWRLPWIRRLLISGKLEKHLIWQARLGAVAAKPTNLGTTALPGFAQDFAGFYQPVDWQALQLLQGKNDRGEWHTSSAKEYPALMNRALAYTHVKALAKTQPDDAVNGPRISGLDSDFHRLYRGDTDMSAQVMRPDYHKRSTKLDHLD